MKTLNLSNIIQDALADLKTYGEIDGKRIAPLTKYLNTIAPCFGGKKIIWTEYNLNELKNLAAGNKKNASLNLKDGSSCDVCKDEKAFLHLTMTFIVHSPVEEVQTAITMRSKAAGYTNATLLE